MQALQPEAQRLFRSAKPTVPAQPFILDEKSSSKVPSAQAVLLVFPEEELDEELDEEELEDDELDDVLVPLTQI